MDISKLDIVSKAEEGTKLYFTHPGDADITLPIFMKVMGADSKVYKKAKRAQQIEMLNSSVMKKKKVSDLDLDQSEQEDTEILAKVVMAVGETETVKGKEVDSDFILDGERQCKATQKDVIHLLTKFPWMREQVSMFIRQRSNFLD